MIPEGTVKFFVTLGAYLTNVEILTNSLAVKTSMAYNIIYSQPLLNVVGAVPSTYHQVMKFLLVKGLDV